MPKLNPLISSGRLKAYSAAIHALQLELDDAADDAVYEHLVEIRALRDKLLRERTAFAKKHGLET